ncbi:UNVERIFIED_CONTAM: hypothetical protein NCL1_09031 [Trichonephila clavipes]
MTVDVICERKHLLNEKTLFDIAFECFKDRQRRQQTRAQKLVEKSCIWCAGDKKSCLYNTAQIPVTKIYAFP